VRLAAGGTLYGSGALVKSAVWTPGLWTKGCEGGRTRSAATSERRLLRPPDTLGLIRGDARRGATALDADGRAAPGRKKLDSVRGPHGAPKRPSIVFNPCAPTRRLSKPEYGGEGRWCCSFGTSLTGGMRATYCETVALARSLVGTSAREARRPLRARSVGRGGEHTRTIGWGGG